MSALPRPTARVEVETSASWAAWDPAPTLAFLGGSEGQGRVPGTATLAQDWGTRQTVDDRDPIEVPESTGLARRFVRLVKVAATGAGERTPFWWGEIQEPDALPTATIGRTAWQAVDLANAVLGRCQVRGGWAIAAEGDVAAEVGRCPAFNANPSGDRSATTYAIGTRQVFISDLDATTGLPWYAGQILDTLFAAHALPCYDPDTGARSGLPWTIDDPLGLLDYNPGRYEAEGKDLLTVLNELASADRGMSWTFDAFDGVPTIRIVSGVAELIVCGAFHLRANPVLFDLVAGDGWISGLRIAEDHSQVADIIEGRGDRPLVGITLAAIAGTTTPDAAWSPDSTSALDKAWTADEQATADAWMANRKTPNRPAGAGGAWRRFKLRQGWLGSTWGRTDTGLRNYLSYGGADYGANGFDGDRFHLPGTTPNPAARSCQIEGSLPCSPAWDVSDRTAPRQPPVLLLGDGTSWQDMSNAWRVEISNDPQPTISIDDGKDGWLLRSFLTRGWALLLTIGLRETHPLKVSWIRDPAEWPNQQPRVRRFDAPGLGEGRVLKWTVRGLHPATGVPDQTDPVEVWNDIGALRALLAQARAWHTEPRRLVSWTDRATLDITRARAPGVLLATADAGRGPVTVNALIGCRTWTLVRDGDRDACRWDTSYQTALLYPTLEALL